MPQLWQCVEGGVAMIEFSHAIARAWIDAADENFGGSLGYEPEMREEHNKPSRYQGVVWCATAGRWRAQPYVDGERKTGPYRTEEMDAAQDVARLKGWEGPRLKEEKHAPVRPCACGRPARSRGLCYRCLREGVR